MSSSRVEPLAPETSAVAEARSRLDAVLSLSTDGILIISLDGTVLGCNRAAEQIYGYRASEIIGRPITTVVPPDRLSEAAEIYRGVAQGETIERFETTRVRRDGAIGHRRI